MAELRARVTTSELAHWMALFSMYPMGEEAMDARTEAILNRLDEGLPVVQVKRSRKPKSRPLFDREFWTRPLSPKMLAKKLKSLFARNFGMEIDE